MSPMLTPRAPRQICTVNIGLDCPDGTVNNAEDTQAALLAAGFFLLESPHVHHSDTEQTLVARVAHESPFTAGYWVAKHLNQDCIAVLRADGRGLLVGPNSGKWGEFNPSFFLNLDGTRAA